MKKWLIAFVGCTLMSATAFGQAVLPTSYDFETSPAVPTGWTTNTTSTYSTGVSGLAGKLNFDDQYFTVNFNDDPGAVSYWLKGWVGGAVTSWVGTFTIEESVDGITWTTMRQIVDNLDESNYVQYTDMPNPTSRYIRWYYTDKQSGANVGIDDVAIAMPTATPAQEINCVYNAVNTPTGSQIAFNSAVNTTTPVSITIENLGTTNTLNITGTNVTGANSSEFVVTGFPATVAALSNGTLTIDFTPTASGTRLATLEISSDDANENPYIIYLYGVGGNFATEPSTAPTALSFANVKSYRTPGSFTASGADGYLVVYKSGSAITGTPADGTAYLPGDAVGDGKVVYSGPSTSFNPNNIVANTNYFFDVYAYNGFGNFTNYLEASPLSGNQASTDGNIGAYYSGLDVNAATFVSDLGTTITHSNWEWYGDYDEVYINRFAARDTTGGQKVITGVYSGEQYIYSVPFTWSVYSREHTFPHSWMPTNPADNPEQLEYNDMHHIFPSNFSNANQVRLNYPLGIVTNVQSTFMGAKFGTNAAGQTVYEPRDEHKGDAARAIFYVCTRYEVENIFEDWSLPENISIFIPYGQDEAILKDWHWNDLPSDWEIARNDFIDSVQGNRNPFVDSVDYVCYINFGDMTHNPSGNCAVGINDLKGNLTSVDVYPNPNQGEFTVDFQLASTEKIALQIIDITGKVVYSETLNGQAGDNVHALQLQLANGIYEMELRGETFTTARKVVVK